MKTISTFFLILIGLTAWAQHSFEYISRNDGNGGLFYTFETMDSNYVALGSFKTNAANSYFSAKIIKLDNFGNFLSESLFPKQDSNHRFLYGLQKCNGNYLIVGEASGSGSYLDSPVTSVCELNQDLELVWEKRYRIPEIYRTHSQVNFVLDADSNVLVQGQMDASLIGSDDYLFISKINMSGDMLEFKTYDGWKDAGISSTFLYNFDSTGYVLMGPFAENSAFLREWVELDLDLEITNTVSVIDYDHFCVTPVTAKWLANGELIVGQKYTQGNGQDLYVKIMDQDLNTLRDTVFDFEEYAYMPVRKGLDFVDESNIWLATFDGVSINDVIRVYLFDADMSLKGMKEYGGDREYWLFNLLATSDGGCIITGMIPDYNGATIHDGYVLKVMPEDILTNIEDGIIPGLAQASVYPTPFTTDIYIKTEMSNCQFLMFDAQGRHLITEKNICNGEHHISTSHLPPGIYFYFFENNKQKGEYGKLVKF